MRILDKNNAEVTNPDLEKGYLTYETIVIKHHDAVEARPGRSHVEVVKEYSNGGKDAITVWDEKPTEAKDAWDETEDIQRYIPYTAEELEKIATAKEKENDRKTKINSLYDADMTFTDVVDAIAELAYGGTK